MPSKFEMKDIDETNYVLAIKILRDRLKRLIGLSLKTYIKKIFVSFQKQSCKPIDSVLRKGRP